MKKAQDVPDFQLQYHYLRSADKSGKTIDQMKADIDLVADRQLTYLDFWYRLAADDVKRPNG